jgi:uncharacterized membrane protein (UPF0127 family)
MLVKAVDSYNFMEDFGILDGKHIHFYETGAFKIASKSKVAYAQVVRVNVMWVDKPVKVKCSHIADTDAKKTAGLEVVDHLEENEGMYFPYKPYAQVAFHQGKVAYPLDIIFVKDDAIVGIQAYTKVGSTDTWQCSDVTSVIEVNAGFCVDNEVEVGDKLVMFACSAKDIEMYETERKNGFANLLDDDEHGRGKFQYMPNVVHLLSTIADVL